MKVESERRQEGRERGRRKEGRVALEPNATTSEVVVSVGDS